MVVAKSKILESDRLGPEYQLSELACVSTSASLGLGSLSAKWVTIASTVEHLNDAL